MEHFKILSIQSVRINSANSQHGLTEVDTDKCILSRLKKVIKFKLNTTDIPFRCKNHTNSKARRKRHYLYKFDKLTRILTKIAL